MAWTIEVSDRAVKTLRKLDKQIARQIRDKLKQVAALDDPRSKGKGLTGNLAGFWRYRVNDYRIVCEIRDGALIVLVIDAEHRSKVYRRNR